MAAGVRAVGRRTIKLRLRRTRDRDAGRVTVDLDETKLAEDTDQPGSHPGRPSMPATTAQELLEGRRGSPSRRRSARGHQRPVESGEGVPQGVREVVHLPREA